MMARVLVMLMHVHTWIHSDDDAQSLFDDREARRQADPRGSDITAALPNAPPGLRVGAVRQSASL